MSVAESMPRGVSGGIVSMLPQPRQTKRVENRPLCSRAILSLQSGQGRSASISLIPKLFEPTVVTDSPLKTMSPRRIGKESCAARQDALCAGATFAG